MAIIKVGILGMYKKAFDNDQGEGREEWDPLKINAPAWRAERGKVSGSDHGIEQATCIIRRSLFRELCPDCPFPCETEG